MEITNDESGKPEIILLGETLKTINEMTIGKISVSLSHLKKNSATAVILVIIILIINNYEFTTNGLQTVKRSIKAAGRKNYRNWLSYTHNILPFYRDLFASSILIFPILKPLKTFHAIPTTEKENLQQRNDDFLCVGREKIIEYTSTSGTLGSPVTIALTENDLNGWLLMNTVLFCAPMVNQLIFTS